MADSNLSKWDFAFEFMLYEAAALIVGIDPAEIYVETKPAKDNPRIYDYHEHPQIKPVIDRMKLSYFDAYELFTSMRDGGWTCSHTEPLSNNILRSRRMMGVPLGIGSPYLPLDPAMGKTLDDLFAPVEDLCVYETAKFHRHEIARWLSAIGMKSVYQFDLPTTTVVQSDPDIDPADLPVELDAANMAYRAVLNGYGNQSDTFKNRLINYLQMTYTDLKTEAVQRIATVANPDKAVGRKRLNKE